MILLLPPSDDEKAANPAVLAQFTTDEVWLVIDIPDSRAAGSDFLLGVVGKSRQFPLYAFQHYSQGSTHAAGDLDSAVTLLLEVENRSNPSPW